MNDEKSKNLFEDSKKCKDLCYEYNNTLPSNEDKRNLVLKNILGKSGNNLTITQPFYCDLGYNIEIGDNFYSNHNLTILDGAKISIGNYVFIGPNCCVCATTHPIDFKQRNEGIEYALEITIKDNVWIGANVTILPGVTIGKNCVIGASSVVTKDVPDNMIAVGNPCKVLREISDEDKLDKTKHNILCFTKE